MKPKAEITHIKITLGQKKYEFTLDEAKALKKALEDTLGPTITYPVQPVVEREPVVPIQPYPYPWSTGDTPLWPPGTIICKAGE